MPVPKLSLHPPSLSRALLLVLMGSVLACASDYDPWDEPAWVPEGGGIGGPPFLSANSTAARDCLRDSIAYVPSVDHLPTWAIQMLASSSDVREGLGNAFPPPLGEFEGCQSISPTSDFLDIVGKYCVANVTLIGPGYGNSTGARGFYLVSLPSEMVVNYLLAFCSLPHCSPAGMTGAIEYFYNRSLGAYGHVRVMVNQFECKTWRREQPMHGGEIAVLFFLVMFAVIVVIGTGYEGFMRKKRKEMSGPGSRILVSFSLLTNAPKLFSVTSNESTMNFLFGLKFLSISWIVFGHTFYSSSVVPLTNPYYFGQFSKEWTKMLVLNESVSVDTFFVISGLLLAIVFLRERETRSSFNLIAFYVHRILRLTPPYAVVVFFYATLFYRLGSGPAWDVLVGANTNTCRMNWWTNLLYVNNYVNIDQPCMDHSWYLAVDTQFYFVSPVVLFLMYKYRYFRKYCYPILVLAAVLVPFSITAAMHLQGAIFFNSKPEDSTSVFTNVYTRAYARAGPYLVGIGLGFFLHKHKGENLIIPKYYVALGWILSTLSCLAVIFGVFGQMQLDHVYNVWESSFYAGSHRTVWAMGVAWVIFACCHGYAGPVNSILSWKLLAPLGRLTYCIYLCHYIVILYFVGTKRAPTYLSVNEVVRNFLGNLVIAIVVSIGLSLTFESPFIGISRAFVKRGAKAPRSDVPRACEDAEGGSPGKAEGVSSVEDVLKKQREEGKSRQAAGEGSPLKQAYSNAAYEATP